MAVCSLVSQLFGSSFYLRHLSTCPMVSTESYQPLDFTGSSQLIEFTALFQVNYDQLGCFVTEPFCSGFYVIQLGRKSRLENNAPYVTWSHSKIRNTQHI